MKGLEAHGTVFGFFVESFSLLVFTIPETTLSYRPTRLFTCALARATAASVFNLLISPRFYGRYCSSLPCSTPPSSM